MVQKRNQFAEIAEGFDALSAGCAGKRIFSNHEVEVKFGEPPRNNNGAFPCVQFDPEANAANHRKAAPADTGGDSIG